MKHKTWKTKALRKFVLEKPGDDFAYLAETIDSLSRTSEIFDFHRKHAHDALQPLTSDTVGPEQARDLLASIHRRSGVLAAEAHLIATLYATRAMYDIFAQLVNKLLLAKPFAVDRCYLSDVVGAMETSPLKGFLEAVQAGRPFRYLTGFINATKHRKLLTISRHADIGASMGLKVVGFQHKYKDVIVIEPPKWAGDLLGEAVYLKEQMIECGLGLCSALGIPDQPAQSTREKI